MAGIRGHSAALYQFSSVNRVQAAIDGYEIGRRQIIIGVFNKIVILTGVYDIEKGVKSSSPELILDFK